MMSKIDPKAVNKSLLRDIGTVKIDMDLPQSERLKSFVSQIGNPYCYLDGDIVVSIKYADTEISLQDRLKSYVSNLQ